MIRYILLLINRNLALRYYVIINSTLILQLFDLNR